MIFIRLSLHKHMEQLTEDIHRGIVNSATIQYFIDANDETKSLEESEALHAEYTTFASKVGDSTKTQFVEEQIKDRIRLHKRKAIKTSLELYYRLLRTQKPTFFNNCPDAFYGRTVNELIMGSTEALDHLLRKDVIFSSSQRTELIRLVENLIRKQETLSV